MTRILSHRIKYEERGLSMIVNDLSYISAVEAIAQFKARKLSPVELMKAVIARAEAVEPKINAFTFKFFEQALEKAKIAEDKYARKGARLRPLEGIPCAIKDESAIKGQITSFGSLFMKDMRMDYTSPVVERILRAGAIVHARSATPEFSCAPITYSKLWGVTRNPWNTNYSPGGSSGGAAASLAAGATTLANGSDIGGSIRIPASTCGIVGFKPPYGRNPEDPPFNLDFYCHAGPLARTVDDCAILQNTMSGPHPKDISTVRPKLRIPEKLGDIKGWRIAYSLDLGYFEIDQEVEKNTKGALDVFRNLGAEVEEVKIGWTLSTLTAAMNYLGHIFGAYIGTYLHAHRYELTDYARYIAEFSEQTTAADFLDSLVVAGQMYETLGPLLEKYNLLICPTTAVPSVAADHNLLDPEFRINGEKVDAYIQWCMTYPFNMLSRCPVMSVPSGRASNGVPTGIQLVGRTYDDVSVFKAAKAYETARPWLDETSNRPQI